MVANHYRLSTAQKKQLRKESTKANNRLRRAQRALSEEGMDIMPYSLARDWQVKEDWHTEKTPISSSVSQFQTEHDYNIRMKELRMVNMAPTIVKFKEQQTQRTINSLNTAFNGVLPQNVKDTINSLNSKEQTEFWNSYHTYASKLGANYNSEATAMMALQEIMPEDVDGIFSNTKQDTLRKDMYLWSYKEVEDEARRYGLKVEESDGTFAGSKRKEKEIADLIERIVAIKMQESRAQTKI